MEDKTLAKIVSSLKKYDSVVAVYLFGSHARGRAGPMSDTDLAVFLHPYYRNTALELGSYSSPYVDIVIFNEAPPYLKFEIMRDGKPLYVRDKNKLEHMLFMAMKEYHDYVPFYERQGLLQVKS
ncbi:nucleotidyltransferase domain-containing protein [Candidatus Micrarchaeota archaeon]|nr:nucleotidyltransferase domain-containing protein [Candidatus Micrarchaeota archaeon]